MAFRLFGANIIFNWLYMWKVNGIGISPNNEKNKKISLHRKAPNQHKINEKKNENATNFCLSHCNALHSHLFAISLLRDALYNAIYATDRQTFFRIFHYFVFHLKLKWEFTMHLNNTTMDLGLRDSRRKKICI